MRCFYLMTLFLLSSSIETSKGRNMINRFTVMAEWCEWSNWSMCSVGIQMRTRECGCPVARDGGAPCEGNDIESRSCPMNFQASREDYDSDGQLVGFFTIPHDMGSGDEYETEFAGGDPDATTEYYEEDYDYDKHENRPTADYQYNDYEYERERHTTQEPSSTMNDLDYECNNFREVMKEDQEKANFCCDVWKNFVASTNDTLFELATDEKQFLDEGPYDEETVNSPLSSVLASFELSNQEKNEINDNPKPDYDDHFVSTSPQATSEVMSMENMSELNQCMSRSMDDNPDALMGRVVMARGVRSKCTYPVNIVRTVCCAYRHCYLWKHAGLRGACSECRDAKKCYCNGVPLSG